METKTPIIRAVHIAGSQKRLSELVGCSEQTVSAWIKRESIPAERCPDIERATNGAVTCEELRPDLSDQWAYLRSTGQKAA